MSSRKTISLFSFCSALVIAALLPSSYAGAATPPPSATDEVIRLEARWIAAILRGDRSWVGAILAPNFKHFTNDGKILDRDGELATITKEPFTIGLSEQTVDFDKSGDAAVLHGLDTISQPGKPTRHARFTDVFFKERGTWMAVSAQENVLAL